MSNSRSDQITYGYGSLLPTDALYNQCATGIAPGAVCAVGVMDRHFKSEPPAVHLILSGPFNIEQPITTGLPDLSKPFSVFSN